ncbi:MAG: DNA topoisomerase IB [Acidobacteriia bacterium]|nr:DNA topoisomerase IB [Terriglobia bacterium]
MFSTDAQESAAEAGLRYVRAAGPCIRRVRSGKGFRYIGPDGRPLRDPKHLKRIRSLVIPPAWEDVWICPSPNGHLQAVGWDAKGRKQYRYHPQYRATRDQAKFSRMIAFGAVRALIRRRVERDLRRRGLPREKVLAAVVRLLETTFIRVGNDEYARENDSFGLTTLRDRHVRVHGGKLQFCFRGKSGQQHTIALTDERLAHIVKQCRDLPGYELFQYVNEAGEVCRVCSEDVNRYIHAIAGEEFTAKDFRTWAGTLLAAREIYAAGPAPNPTAAKKTVVNAIKSVAAQLGNRPATCRKYYIHPAIFDAYADRTLFQTMEQGQRQEAAYNGSGLRPEEYAVMVIIAEYQQRLAKAA